MGHPRRIYVPGLSVHVIRRGHNRGSIFCDDLDYLSFLLVLQAAARRYRISLHGYVLMTNHYHLLATPHDADSLSAMMRDLGALYVRYFNRRNERIGTLWSGRYRAIPIGDERYWLTCLRYIEQNPVRARMVRSPSEYKWSSHAVHAAGEPSDWLVLHDVYLALGPNTAERQAAYRELCDAPLTDVQLTRQRHPGRASMAPHAEGPPASV